MQKLKIVAFLLSSAGILRMHFGGTVYLINWCLRSSFESGFKLMVVRLLEKAAYLQRSNRSWYQRWIDRYEHLATRGPIAATQVDVLLTPKGELGSLWRQCIEMLLTMPEVGMIFIPVGETTGSDQWSSKKIALISDYVEFADVLKASPSPILCHLLQPAVPDLHQCRLVTDAPGADWGVVISDHDYLIDGLRSQPYFKPGWCEELLAEPGYLPFYFAGKTTLMSTLLSLSGPVTDGSSLFNQLRDVNQIRMRHKILGHCLTASAGSRVQLSSGQSDESNPFAVTMQKIKGKPKKVSVLIPTKDALALLQPCIESIEKNSADCDLEIVVIDNGSRDADIIEWLEKAVKAGRLKVLSCDYDFNWSKLNNDGASICDGEVLIFLNNDTLVISPDWIEILSNRALQPGVGIVGPLLLYPDQTIQHAGIVFGYGGFADHLYVGEPVVKRPTEIFVSPLQPRTVSAVTGACLVILRSTFDMLGGFDESLTVAGDVDLCLRATGMGLSNFYEPAARLYHLESKTRKGGLPESDKLHLQQLIQQVLPDGDPFYNPNLSLKSRSPFYQF